ncbi:MAG: hypothetical protein HOC91_17055 [Nitrospinaceae bacterium]|nr:hypothetical protein [Nitrospinaceae bacterium]MBT3820991.1 hypothetical protein [Nitrospinaceae bacterium]MBT4093367.1 hypothetical protein [Nitrospinaceae bacterium]MBT4432221.1 hypothetical protein [Nitrospinaceae bacterium]MBT5368454.1 hypothetical protein [Nitrospinaceae bacterium]
METMTNILDFKNIHKGEKIFILSSRPSLSNLNLDSLAGHIVLGLNRSNLFYPDARYQCTMDIELVNDSPEMFSSVGNLFTPEGCSVGIPLKLLGAEGFSQDLEMGVYSGYSISYLALQLAAYMGFEDIYCLGLDLRRHEDDQFFGTDNDSGRLGNTQFPWLLKMFEYAAQVLKDTEVNVYNCIENSGLDCFPEVTFDEALELACKSIK